MKSAADPSGSMNSNLGDLTLIIPTLNRQPSVQRTMTYWSGRGPQVLVLDGSPDPISVDFLETLAGNISYIHGPHDAIQRLSLVRTLVETDFICLHGDDELHLPSALVQCVRVLREHPDLVACIGWALGFRVENGGEVTGHDQYTLLRDYGLSAADPIERVTEHMSPYRVPAHTYAVTRSDAYLCALDIVCSSQRLFFAQAEYEIEIATAAQGKTLVIPQLHWLRNMTPSDLRNTSEDTTETYRLEDFWLDASKSEQRKAFIGGLASGLAEHAGIELETLEEKLTRLFTEEANRLANRRGSTLDSSFSLRRLYRRATSKLSAHNQARVIRYKTFLSERFLTGRAVSLERKAIELESLGARVDKDELLEAKRFLQTGK